MLGISRFGRTLGLGAAIFLHATVSSAKITWDLKPSGTGTYDWSLLQHWTFNRTGAVGDWGGCNGECNYHSLGVEGDGQGGNVSWGSAGAAPMCLELTTKAGPWTANPDTVIEVQDPNAEYSWKGISDDFGGTLLSHARIWIEATGTLLFRLRVRAYNSNHNSEHFYMQMIRRDISKEACTSNQTTIPWTQITDSGVALSTFH